ncbi:filamentous hemagglutinin N-terminal domain-containing protein [Acaryochloris marina]|uniref:Haemagglutination activity domain protein n=1 Tax=Acaryochloris marina (strain MBIC 11017) TaxID=329726 RepID=A8ZP72_ACAM1|nr:filamentous hemagglutinin N-terminal domain-containing protein [Acaryochloris marina]ABW32808.1 haemagglutination activity domain protein [Acaryochloris marina MBIC11017]
MNQSILLTSALAIWSVLLTPGLAQVSADRTLGNENSVIEQQRNRILIKGGASRNKSLFHSLKDLSIGTGQEVYFSNPNNINLILTRVTGGNPSNINGTLGVLGDADLFLMNPSGIYFGPNSFLDLNGSFLATTGSRFIFKDGKSFSAINPQPVQNLKLSIPIGIQFGNTAQDINIQSVYVVDPSITTCMNLCFSEYPNLRVKPRNTISILGGGINFLRGGIQVLNGNIEIGSVAPRSYVSLQPTNQGWLLGYEDVGSFKDINVKNSSKILIDSSDSSRNKYLRINSRNLNVENNGLIDTYSYFNGTGGNIFINTRNALNIDNSGTISSNSYQSSSGGNILINSKNTTLENMGKISSNSNVFGKAGNITIASKEILLRDNAEIGLFSSNAPGGSLSITGNNLTLEDNASISMIVENQRLGDLNIELDNILLLRNKSKIKYDANGLGIGGLIDFDVRLLVGLEESLIEIDAPLTQFNIESLGFFDSNGQFIIDAAEKYKESLAQPKDVIKSCRPGQSLGNSTFVNVGRGGVPLGPHHIQTPPSIWQDLREPQISPQNSPSSTITETSNLTKRETYNQSLTPASNPTIVEAQRWIRDKQGRVVLTANTSKLMTYNSGQSVASC